MTIYSLDILLSQFWNQSVVPCPFLPENILGQGGRRVGPRAPAPHLGPREEAPGAWKPRAVLEKLKLSRQEISVAAEVVNRLGDHLLRRLNSRESEFKGVDLLRAGSYYERVKVSRRTPPPQFPGEYPAPARPSLPFGSNA